jgi:hypothetical protein
MIAEPGKLLTLPGDRVIPAREANPEQWAAAASIWSPEKDQDDDEANNRLARLKSLRAAHQAGELKLERPTE